MPVSASQHFLALLWRTVWGVSTSGWGAQVCPSGHGLWEGPLNLLMTLETSFLLGHPTPDLAACSGLGQQGE